MTEDDARTAQRFEALAASACDRFKTRLDWEFKARLALWTALAVATGFVVTNETWAPSTEERIGISLISGLVVIFYVSCFSIPVHRLHRCDFDQIKACEAKVAELCESPESVSHDANFHYSCPKSLTIGQCAITTIFATALVLATLGKDNQVPQPGSKVVIEGRGADSIVIAPNK